MYPIPYMKPTTSPSVSRLGEFSIESEVTDVKILLIDGTEVPAKIVLRDSQFRYLSEKKPNRTQ